MAWYSKLFGFQIEPANTKTDLVVQDERQKSFVIPQNDDGAVTIQTGAYYGTYLDLEGVVRNEIELITRYREMAMQPELESAIDDIVNETIVVNDSGTSVEINCDDLQQKDVIKKKIQDEFANILKMFDFGNMGHDIYRRWYIDGRMFYHIIIDETKPSEGIKELRYIDPRRIRKVREIQKTKDANTGADIIKNIREYYIYNERGIIGVHSNMGTRISTDSIVNVNSGLMDSRRAMVLSYLHKAIKPLNQLRMVEDATVIYRLSRAPERRVFYIDTGNLPKIKAEQYVRDIMVQYRNKMVYDSSTGEVRNDRKHLSMLEDFWLPRREGTKGTEIDTLPGGENLGKMEDVDYFKKKLYNSLGVPIGRLEPQQGFSLGRIGEITREELKFTKFIMRLRNKFSTLFDDVLRVQLVLKGVCTKEEWNEFKEQIWYDYLKDNNFNELKEAELLRERLANLALVEPYIGRFYSSEWVKKNVLCMTDKDMTEMKKQMEEEKKSADPGTPLGAALAQAEQQQEIYKQFPDLNPANAQPPAGGPEQPEADPGPDPEAQANLDAKFKSMKVEHKDLINTIRRVTKERRTLNEQR